MTQEEQILEYMERNGSITPLEAMNEFGIMRLGARIYDLKESGVKIITETVTSRNRAGKRVRFARYRLERDNA